jgi:hypothetical protein
VSVSSTVLKPASSKQAIACSAASRVASRSTGITASVRQALPAGSVQARGLPKGIETSEFSRADATRVMPLVIAAKKRPDISRCPAIPPSGGGVDRYDARWFCVAASVSSCVRATVGAICSCMETAIDGPVLAHLFRVMKSA